MKRSPLGLVLTFAAAVLRFIKRTLTSVRFWLISAVIMLTLTFLLLSACAGNGSPIEFVFYSLVGWWLFIRRATTEVRINPAGFATAAVVLLLAAFGLHSFLGWLYRGIGRDRPWRVRWTLSLLGVMALSFAAGLAAVGVTHQAARMAEPPNWTTDFYESYSQYASDSNLRSQARAFSKFDNQNHTLPHDEAFDDYGRTTESWMTQLLPFVEQEALYKSIDRSRPWDDAVNAAAYAKPVPAYQYLHFETSSPDGYALANYAGNVHVFGHTPPPTFEQLKRHGLASTVLVGEAAGRFQPWGAPRNWRDPALGLNQSPSGFGNPAGHRVTRILMADGRVAQFTAHSDPTFLQSIAHPQPHP